jgi:F-type H+-transporting ATPase subunit b
MLNINPSTILLQTANFFILVFVLYRFLFKPLQNAMKQREAEVTRTMNDAQKAKQEAEAERRVYEEKSNNIDAEIAARKNEARMVIEQTRQQMLKEVQTQVDRVKQQTEETLSKLRSEALQQHKEDIGNIVTTVAKRLMTDMMSPQVQAVYQDDFLEKIQSIDLAEYVQGSSPGRLEYIKAIMAETPSDDFKNRLSETLHNQITHKIDLSFEVNPDLIAGGLLRFENELIDGSLEGQINRLARKYQEQV